MLVQQDSGARPGQRFDEVDGDNRYALSVEIEAGSRWDAADGLIVE